LVFGADNIVKGRVTAKMLGGTHMVLKVLINSIEKAEHFVEITNDFDCDIDLVAGKNIYLDGKSILGIMSCNICEPVTMIVNCDDVEENNRLTNELSPYIVL